MEVFFRNIFGAVGVGLFKFRGRVDIVSDETRRCSISLSSHVIEKERQLLRH